MRILLTEDDKDLANITAQSLKKYGFNVDIAYSGEEALFLLEEGSVYDVIILDLILPDIDGIKLLENIKAIVPNVPILALTAKDAKEDRISGIKKGFDDYLTKPFSHQELAARLRVLYRSQPYFSEEEIKINSLYINPKSQVVSKNETPIKLTLNEFRVLHYLAKHKGKVVSTDKLLKAVWDRNSDNGRAKVLTTISRLRKKIGDKEKKIIKTRNGGYVI